MRFSRLLPTRPLLLAALAALMLTQGQSAWGQSIPAAGAEAPPALPDRLSKDQVDDLVARLSDEEVRALLIRELDRTAVDEEAEPDRAVIERFMIGMQRAEAHLDSILAARGEVFRVPGELWHSITAGTAASVWGVWLKIAAFLAAGLLLELLFRRSVTNVGRQTTPDSAATFGQRFKLSFLRAVIEAVAVLVFVVGSLLAWLFTSLPTENAEVLFSSILTGLLLWRMFAVASRMVLAPRVPWLRLVYLDDGAARDAHFKVMLIVTVVVFVLWLSGEVMDEFGLAPDVRGAAGLVNSAFFIGVVIWVIWSLRPARPDGGQAVESGDYFARNWHVMAIVGTIIIYVLALGVHFATGARVLMPALASLIVIGALPILDMGLRGAVHRFMAAAEGEESAIADGGEADRIGPAAGETPSPETGQATAQIELADGHGTLARGAGSRRSYESVVVNNVRILLFLFSIFAFAEIWDLNLFGLMKALFGARLTSVIVNFSITALLAYALWSIVSTAVARVAGPEAGADQHGAEGGGEGSRLGTVLPLFKKFLFITLIIMLVLIFLSSLGVDIGPLIAGAGIVGIAIGFGAQTLVKDIVSGLFFLLDDAFRVGEYVTIGDTKGTVEKISVRSLRLRHHNGPLHTVPFGEITTLTNWSRDWAVMKFEIRVPFETDVDLVRRIIKKVGQQMLEDEELGPMFLDPLKSQGVNRMDDSSFIIRCKFTSKPGNQFYVRREAYARIQAAFEERGIKFAPKRVIVETVSPDVTPQAAAAAASAATETEQAPQQVKDEPG